MVLAGDPGIGKTRLAAELAHSAFEQGACVLAGRASEATLVPCLADSALAALDRGDMAGHDSAAADAARTLADCDLVALAQFSDATFSSDETQRYLAEYGKDVAQAQQQVSQLQPPSKP